MKSVLLSIELTIFCIFENMIRTIFLFALMLPLLVACPISNSSTKAANELYANKMDFKKWKKLSFKSVSFVLPEKFEEEVNFDYTFNKYSSKQYSLQSLFLYFSVEIFSDTSATYLQYVNNQKSNLHAVQKNYVNSILVSLTGNYDAGYRISEIKQLNKNCLSQVIIENFNRQNKWDSDQTSTYFIATKKINKSFYVFQFVGKTENMHYLQDDFFKIVNSVR
jgi:hypothetical protein